MLRCGLYNVRGEIQPLKSVDVGCTVREDFACQVNLTQVFQMGAPKKMSVNVTDSDGDKLELRKTDRNTIQGYVNGSLELRKVTRFQFDCNSGEYEDNGGKGTIPAADRLPFARKLSWLFEQANKSHLLDIVNEPEGGLKPLEKHEIPKLPVETSYYFPLDGNAAVYAFRATLEDGTKIDGIVQEKNQARETYAKAKKEGKEAFLLEREKSDIFQISLGNVNAGERIKIEISYIAELEMRGGRIRLRIPNRIAPKCGGGPMTNVNYPINFDFAIRTSTKIGKIEALGGVDLHTELVPGDERCAIVKASREGFMNEDLVLMIGQEMPYGIYSTIERSYKLNSECLRVTFNKELNTDMDMDATCEIIFVVDKSGSMKGDRMETTKFALTLFLRSLPENSKFNIVAFDRSWNSCFNEATPYNDNTLQIAQAYVDRINASGGTNINGPLDDVLSKEEDEDYPRTIILLTDGEVNNTEKCIETARKGGCRIFTIGVGRSFSQELVEGIAKASNGTWQAVHNTEDMGNVVMMMLANALKPMITKCKVDLGPFGKAKMWPDKIPQMMDGTRTTLYWMRPLQLEGDQLPPKFAITLSGCYNNGETFTKELNVITGDFEGITENQLNRSKQQVDSIIHRVAALSKIKRLEKQRQGRKQKNEIRDMGLKYTLATSETSFVAVRNHDEEKAKETDVDVILGEAPVEPDFKMEYEQNYCSLSLSQHSYQPAPKMAMMSFSRSKAMPESRLKKKMSKRKRQSKSRVETGLVMRGMPVSPPSGPPMPGGMPQAGFAMAAGSAPPMPGGGPPAAFMKQKESANAIPGGTDVHAMFGGPPIPAAPMPVSKPSMQSKKSSSLSEFGEVAASPFTPEHSALEDASADLFLSNLHVGPVKSAADQQESRVEMLQDGMDWDDMSEESEEEIQAFEGDMIKVALEFKWLLTQQSASGMFKFSPLDPRFLDYKKKNISGAVKDKLKDVNNLNSVLATLYALASMTTQFASQKTEWQFMFSKGKRWVSKQLKDKTDFDGLLALLT